MKRKIDTGRMEGPVIIGREGRPYEDLGGSAGSGCATVEFSKEEIEALLNEKIEGKKFDTKGKMENDHINKLKLCVKWLLKVKEKHDEEGELALKNMEDELNAVNSELKTYTASLQKNLEKEVSAKLEAINSQTLHKEARVAAEKLTDSLREELGRAEQETLTANQTLATLNDLNKKLQTYVTGLERYNIQLQLDLKSPNVALQRIEIQKRTIPDILASLRNHCNSLQASQDEAMRVKEELEKEVGCLRGELQQVREDRDRQITNVHALDSEIAKYAELEETCSSQREKIRTLLHKLAAANEKF